VECRGVGEVRGGAETMESGEGEICWCGDREIDEDEVGLVALMKSCGIGRVSGVEVWWGE